MAVPAVPAVPEPELRLSPSAEFRALPAVPSPPELEPVSYELGAEERLQTLTQCEEDTEDYRSEAAEKNRQLWRSEQASTVRNMDFQSEIRRLEDRAHALQRNLEQSEARETITRRAASEQRARIESDAQLHAQHVCDNFR